MNKKRHILILAIVALYSFGSAQNVYTLQPSKEPVRIGNQFLFLRDASGKLSFDEVLKSDKFQASKEDVPNFDVTPDVIWAKIKFTCKTDADWYLRLASGSLNEVAFYQKRNNGQWQEQKMGNNIPVDKTTYSGHFLLKLNVQPGDTTMVVFRVNDYYPLQLDFTCGTLDTFVPVFHNMDMYNGICFGVMIMMLIYNLYLFFSQRQPIYIYYVLYVLFNGIFLAVFSGYFFHLPVFLQKIILFDPTIFPTSFGIFLLFFTRDLFKGFLPKGIITTIYVFSIIVLGDAIIGALDYQFLAFNVIRILGLFLGVFCMTMGIIALRKGSSSAKFYILGFGFYLSGLTFLIISGHIIPANSVALMAIITGSMLECIFLSFAQGDKLKVFQIEKEKAQQETLVQLQKNESLVREQNTVLEQKVKVRTAELAEKNKEVMDSIHYAQRIQSTLLAHETLLMQNIPEHFVLFKPKDIVSGDFYWAAQKDNGFYFAVCDSTGHGVPGAFMSLLNISFLNEAINEKNISDPNEVFNYVRAHLINSISRDGGRDGMDGILVHFEKNRESLKMLYAAANNEAVIIRNGQLLELPMDKMPVGQGEKMDSFTLNEVQLQKGDMLYLFTDGYADQFGGPKGKKLKHKALVDGLIGYAIKPLQEQRKILDQTFESWKGNLEQIDDVLVIGIRI